MDRPSPGRGRPGLRAQPHVGCLEVNAPAIHEHYHGQWHRFENEPDNVTFWRADLPLAIQGKTIGRLAVSGINDVEPLVNKIVAIMALMEQFQAAFADGSAFLPKIQCVQTRL